MATGIGHYQWRLEDVQRMKLEQAKQEQARRERAEEAKRQAVSAYKALRAAYHSRAWR